MISIKKQLRFVFGLICVTTLTGCHTTECKLASKENPYTKIIIPKKEITNVSFLESVDCLIGIHRELYQKHMDTHHNHKSCGGFPGLHLMVSSLSEEGKKKKESFHFENITMADAFEEVANKFGMKVMYKDGAFASGYVIFEDPNYNPESAFRPVTNQDDPFAEANE